MGSCFDVVVERDQDGLYVASVPALRGCHTQAASLDELMERIRESIELCLEVEGTTERRNWSSSASSVSQSPNEPTAGPERPTAHCCAEVPRLRTRRTQGSHSFLRHADGRATVVPVHAGETIGRGLMAKILRDTALSADQLRDIL